MADHHLKALTTRVVAAYLQKNVLPKSQIVGLITGVHVALAEAEQGPAEAVAAPLTPAVPVRKSVTHDAIICLDCGKACKMLKRHLATRHDLTIEGYRARWGLARDYPMTAPNYAAQRSQMAHRIGLGRKAKG